MSSRSRTLPAAIRGILMVILPIVVILVGVAGSRMLMGMRQAPPAKEATASPAPLVDALEVVELADYHFTVHSQGNVVARRESQLIPQVGGRVERVSTALADGGFFQPKQPLLWIDASDYKVAVANAKLSLAQAERRLAQEQAEADVAIEEWRKLGRTGPVPDLVARVPQLVEARAAVEAARESLNRANADLARTVVKAPDYPGRVDSVSVNVGQTVSPGASVAQLYAIDAVEVRLPLALDDLAYLDLPLYPERASDGSPVNPENEFDGPEVQLTGRVAGREWQWTGRVVRTEGRVNPRTRYLYAVARVDAPYTRSAEQPERPPLMVGLYVNATIAGREAGRVIRLPRSVLHEGVKHVAVTGEDPTEEISATTASASDPTDNPRLEHPSVVYRVDGGGRLSFRTVTVLRRTVDTVYVRANDALQGGDRVVASPLPTAVNGMTVRVAGEDDSSADTDDDAPGDDSSNDGSDPARRAGGGQ